MKIDREYLDNNILPLVQKPISYQGNEVGAVHKSLSPELTRFAFAFPDTYEIGMSHLGMKILYGLLNEREDVWCERVFAPWVDMEKLLRQEKLPLFALESGDALTEFDFVGFTLQYEMSYTNVLNMLDLGHIPLLAAERTAADPIVIAGGPCAYNPEPLADFVDIFFIGEAEESLPELMDLYRETTQRGFDRQGFLSAAAQIEGLYVPAFYEASYHGDGTLASFEPKHEDVPSIVRKRFVADIENVYFPKELVVPYTETVHDRVSMELFRGCGRGCRFCQAGIIYRPTREKSPAKIKENIKELLTATGYDEVSLMSLSTGDYSRIEGLIADLVAEYEDGSVAVSLPSLRIDSVSIDMLEEIQKIRKTGITLAPEAGTQRMRDVINKGVTEQDLIDTVSRAFASGWGRIKLYFIIGLPTETDEDILGIADLGQKVLDAYLATPAGQRNRSIKIVISTSCFIPKPHTPFQWMGQVDREEFVRRQKLLKAAIKDRRVAYNWHDDVVSYLEAVFARGDRRLGKVLLAAHRGGAKFDGWHEMFDYAVWEQAFAETGVNPDFYAMRERPFTEVLPWDFIDTGVTKDFLIKEWEQAMVAGATPYCRDGCGNCGVMEFQEGWRCHDHFAL